MAYCPKCGSEYREGIETCAECGVPLSEAPPETPPMVEVFRCSSDLVAQRISDVILHDFHTVVHQRGMGAFPTPAASVGQAFLAVEGPEVERARQLLADAIADGAIAPEDGMLLEVKG